jgi:flagellum-specific peptidoglycan hydrolase FlgJ
MKPADFIARYAPAAQKTCAGTGLLASICLAQAILESAWGESALTKTANNFFGMKASQAWLVAKKPVSVFPTKEQRPNGQVYTIRAAFKKYGTPEEAFADRVLLFRTLARYQRLFQLTDAATEARQLRECGYATDIHYPEKLLSIINTHKLTRFDS